MRAPKVVRSSEAQNDIRRLYAWIALDSGAVRARAVLQRLDRTISRLALRPGLGRRRTDFENEPSSFTVSPWLIIYRPLPDGDGVRILRIIDSRRDVAALFGKKS
jgi:plasmid stabilization system protein ParE